MNRPSALSPDIEIPEPAGIRRENWVLYGGEIGGPFGAGHAGRRRASTMAR
jgi:hypothetical protein